MRARMQKRESRIERVRECVSATDGGKRRKREGRIKTDREE